MEVITTKEWRSHLLSRREFRTKIERDLKAFFEAHGDSINTALFTAQREKADTDSVVLISSKYKRIEGNSYMLKQGLDMTYIPSSLCEMREIENGWTIFVVDKRYFEKSLSKVQGLFEKVAENMYLKPQA